MQKYDIPSESDDDRPHGLKKREIPGKNTGQSINSFVELRSRIKGHKTHDISENDTGTNEKGGASVSGTDQQSVFYTADKDLGMEMEEGAMLPADFAHFNCAKVFRTIKRQ